MEYKWPLMRSNFAKDDFNAIANLLHAGDAGYNLDVRLTQGPQVKAFEEEFSQWLGVKHSIFVNSGSSANLLTMAALKERQVQATREGYPLGKVLVPCITWSSDITSVLHTGFEPVFVDIDRRTLGMCDDAANKVCKDKPAAVFLTHCMGYPGMSVALWNAIRDTKTPFFEDCCEGPGAIRTETNGWGRKVGTFGLASNFSLYYAHHLTSIEGGMVCTDDDEFARTVRMLRGHGLARESGDEAFKDWVEVNHVDLEPQFVFMAEGYNCRSTEINAVIGRSQLKRLDEGIEKRRELLQLFLSLLDPDLYQTDFAVEGSSPYALTLVLRDNDERLRQRVQECFRDQGVETRRGIAGGGNQLRQPYLRRRYGTMYAEFPNAEHVHWNGYAIGLWPSLEPVEIKWLCEKLNGLKGV